MGTTNDILPTAAAGGMTDEIRQNWIKELRNPENKQCTHTLFDGVGYCCLGILHKSLGHSLPVRHDGNHENFYLAIDDLIGNSNKWTFINMNDDRRKSFEEIAQAIETIPELTTLPSPTAL